MCWDASRSRAVRTDQYRTFYSCLYRSTLFPRKFYEIDATRARSCITAPTTARCCPATCIPTPGFWDTFRSLFPAAEPRLPVRERRNPGRDSLTRLPRERFPARMGVARAPRLHGGQQFRFGGCRCRAEGHERRRPRGALRGDGRMRTEHVHPTVCVDRTLGARVLQRRWDISLTT